MHDPTDIEQLYKEVHEQMVIKYSIWADIVLFTWQWWIGVALSIIPWILWIIFRRKESTLRLLTVGFFVMFLSTFLDSLGVQLGFWYYIHSVLPFIPPYFPWDTTLMPVTVMAFLQYKPNIKPYVKGLIFALMSSYIAEPVAIWMELYKPIIWEHYYSLPIYFVIYLICDKMYRGKSYK
jgi:hypothetical protein